MTPADELVITQLVDDPELCLRLLRKHRPDKGRCKGCYTLSTLADPCKPFRLARIAAIRMGHADDR
jgi:hypothetical protein